MTTKELFRLLQTLVDDACRQKSFQIATAGAASLGMSGGSNEQNHYALEYNFTQVAGDGSKVDLEFYSQDQSKAFDVQPDLYKFKLTLTHSTGIIEVHANEYER